MQPAGFAVTPVAEGERALAKAKGAKPDLILLASALSDMSGFSLCNRLRRTPGLSDIPILLFPAGADAAATESHRAGKTPADAYLSPDSSPDEVLQRVNGLLRAAANPGRPPPLPGGGGDGSPPVLQLTRDMREGTAPGDPVVMGPPPLPGTAPPPLRPVKIVDPFEDLPAEPRLPLGASPDDKVGFFRERLKAKDELLAKVKQSFQGLREELTARDREGSALRKSFEELRAVRLEREGQLATVQAEAVRLTDALDEAQTQLSQKTHEGVQTQREAEERAQSLSELLNATLQEREQSEKQWGAKLAETERKVALLQEEVDHLAAESEASQHREKAQMEALAQLQDALQAARQGSQQEAAAVAEQLAARERETEAVREELGGARKQLETLGGELQGEQARAAALAADLEDLAQQFTALGAEKEAALTEATAQVTESSAQLVEAQAHQTEWSARAAEAEATLAELRGELEAHQQGSMEAQSALGTVEGRLAELEAELQSRTEEAEGLRRELETVRADWETMQDDLAGQIANLTAEVQGKDRELLAKDRDNLAKQRDLVGKERELEAALEREATAKAAPPPPSADTRSAGEQALRVRVSDLTLELQAMRGRIQQLQKGQGSAAGQQELETLKEELEAQRAENEFLSAELERTSERLQELQGGLSSGEEDLTVIKD